jgi:hypothetical protein
MTMQRMGAGGMLLTVVACMVVLVAAASRDGLLAAAPQQATPTDVAAPTEIPPTPEPLPGTPEPSGPCLPGVASPRLFWTLYVSPKVGEATGMWVPYGEHGGPYLKAYVKALYGDVWYGAALDAFRGQLVPDSSPVWPRPDLIQLAGSGVQTSRVGNPMCGRSADSTLPPCYAELVVPLVFLDRLASDGPYLRNTYFWVPSNQVADSEGEPSRMTALEYSSAACETRRVGSRLPSARPVYAAFSGCASASKRIDTCYLAGCGDLWMHCQ